MSSRPIRIGVQLPTEHADYAGLRAAALEAEEKGADLIYTTDHFYPVRGDPGGNSFECWTILAAWAEVTERVEFGPMVTCYGFRNPHLLADMARTVDHVSGGRLVLGLGSGWFERDYTEYEYPFGTVGGRLRDFEAGLYKIERRLKRLIPAPTRPIPILIGGVGEKHTLRLAALYADIWHGAGTPDAIRHKNAVLDHWCAEFGRDPTEIERSCAVHPHEIEMGDEMVAVGADQITIHADGPEFDLGPLDDWVAWRDARNG